MTKQGTAHLASVLDGHAQRRTRRAPIFDLGTIRAGGGLKLDTFAHPFPEGDYLVDERFRYPDPILGPDGGHAQYTGTGVHSHARPAHLRNLTPGDRVICILLEPDSDAPTPVVIGRLA